MVIGKIGRVLITDIKQAAKAGHRVIKRTPKADVKSSSAMTDTFVKQTTQGVLPERVQAIISKQCPNHYYKIQEEFIEKLYRTNPEKFDIILKSEAFQHNAFPFFKDEAFLRATEKLSPKEIEETFSEISGLYKRLPQAKYYDTVTKTIEYRSQLPDSGDIAMLTILRAHNKEAYSYIIKHENPKTIQSLLRELSKMNGSAFETLTIPQIRQVTGEGSNFVRLMNWAEPNYMEAYVESSDLVVRDPEKVKALSKFLSQSKIMEDFSAFRTERDTGMFSSVILDKNMTRKTKMFVLTHFGKARKVKVHDYLGQYETTFAKHQDLLAYIMSKPQLTLADAMQVAKYGNSAYREQIIKMITEAKVPDTRFKSLTFDHGFANGWTITQNGNTPMVQRITVKKGLEGTMSGVNNNQAEFILNNSPKTMTFQKAHYDKKCDSFILDSTIQSGI